MLLRPPPFRSVLDKLLNSELKMELEILKIDWLRFKFAKFLSPNKTLLFEYIFTIKIYC